jgi:hypothetical protein
MPLNQATLADGLVDRAHRACEPLHSLCYFAPEVDSELTGAGLRPGRMCYFASRSAAMGPVTAPVTTATFYNFNPTLVARHLPRAWTLATPDRVLSARLTGVDRALRRLLGDEVASAAEVAEAAELARAATEELDPAGRTLYAAHAALDWPDEPHLALWHAITLLREFRGDGHLAALLGAGLGGIEALLTHTATGRGFTVEAARTLRGWSDEQWQAATDRLVEDGTLTGAGTLTEQGQSLRAEVEAATDRMAAAPWLNLGQERTDRLVDLTKALSRIAVGNGAFPPGVFAAPR